MALHLGPASREGSPSASAVQDNPTYQRPPSPSSPSLQEGLGTATPQQHVHALNTNARRTVQFHDDALPPCSPMASGARRLISFPSRGSSAAESPKVLANLRSTSFALWKADSAQTGACTDSPPVPSLGERLSVAWLWTCTLARATAKLVAYAPLRTLLIPSFALAIFLVAGELGVWAAANSYRSQRETAAASTANSISLQLDFLLQSYITPAIAVGELVTRQPYVPDLMQVGDTVNVSSRMESNSKAMQVHVGSTTAALLSSCPEFALDPRGVIDIKGKGPMSTFWLRATGAPCLYTDDSIAAGTPSRLKETVSKTLSE